MTNFIKINGQLIPTPATLSEGFDNIEEVNMSEAGTERVIITRLQKRSYSLTFQVTQYWKDKLLLYGRQASVSIQIGTENPLTGRFRITSSKFEKNSEFYATTLHTVQATFTQI